MRDAAQIAGDGGVISCRVCKRFRSKALARLVGHAAARRFIFRKHGRVVERIDDHSDAFVILRGGAHHRRPANVDVLDRVLVCASGLRHRRREGIEIDDDEVDGLDAVLAHDFIVNAAAAEQAAMNLRMQRLDASIHDLGKARMLGHLRDTHTALLEQRRGSARGEDRNAALLQRLREFEQTVFAGDAEEGAANGNDHQ